MYSVRMLGGASPPEWVRKAWGSFLHPSKKRRLMRGSWKTMLLRDKTSNKICIAVESNGNRKNISCHLLSLFIVTLYMHGSKWHSRHYLHEYKTLILEFQSFFGRRRPSNFLPSATTPSGHLRLDARTKKEHSTLRKHKLWEERLGTKTVAQREEETVWHARKRLYYWYFDRRIPMQYPGVSQKYKNKWKKNYTVIRSSKLRSTTSQRTDRSTDGLLQLVDQ